MHARLDFHHDRVWLERLLAAAAAAFVAWMLLATSPLEWWMYSVNAYVLLAAAMGIGAWMPWLVRRRWSAVGSLCREGDALVLRGEGRVRRIPLSHIRGARVAPGTRGASLVMQIGDDGVLGAALDDIEDARRLGDELLGIAPATDHVVVRPCRFGVVVLVLRVVTSLFALAVGLTQLRAPIPERQFFFPLGALLSGLALLVVLLLRHGRMPIEPRLATAGFSAALRAHVPRGFSAALRAHFHVHIFEIETTEPAPPPRPRLGEPGELLGAWLARTRRDLAGPDGYRGAGKAIRARLDEVLRSAEVPLRERALALRVLSASEPAEARRRIAEVETLEEGDEAWLEAVALAEDDGSALATLARRPPELAVGPAAP